MYRTTSLLGGRCRLTRSPTPLLTTLIGGGNWWREGVVPKDGRCDQIVGRVLGKGSGGDQRERH